MTKIMFEYTRSVLERVSFDHMLFSKELEKAIRTLLPFELDQLKEWLFGFVEGKPELRHCISLIDAQYQVEI